MEEHFGLQEMFDYFHIGIYKDGFGGPWKTMDGDLVADEDIPWASNEPDDDYLCTYLMVFDDDDYFLTMASWPCDDEDMWPDYGICEYSCS